MSQALCVLFCFVLFFLGGGGASLKFLKELSTLSVCFFPGLGKRKTNARPGPVFPHVPPLHANGWMRGGGRGEVALKLRFVTMYCSWSDGYEVKQEWRQLGTATYKCSKNRHIITLIYSFKKPLAFPFMPKLKKKILTKSKFYGYSFYFKSSNLIS